MRNDLFRYRLMRGSPADKTVLESETLPYTFYTLPTLENYRIYGNTVNGESVGKQNIFDKTKANRQYNVARNADGSLNYNTTASNYLDYYMSVEPSTNYIAKGTKSNNLPYIPTRVYFFDSEKNWLGRTDPYSLAEGGPDYISFTTPSSCAFVQVQEDNTRIINIDKFMIVKGTSVPKSYIPYGYYCIPVINSNQTTNILLDEPLAKSGNNADYIDYKSQKRYNADGTVENVTLPEIAVYDGENEISIDTIVQPSKIYLQGHITETEVLSSRSMQSSPQMLDRSEFQLNDFEQENIVDKMSVDEFERENSVDKMPVNELELKKIGDDENAE